MDMSLIQRVFTNSGSAKSVTYLLGQIRTHTRFVLGVEIPTQLPASIKTKNFVHPVFETVDLRAHGRVV
jgi:hypothetical protein